MSKKSEKLEAGNWSDIPDPPVITSFSKYAVVYDAGNFYYFGGHDTGVGLPYGTELDSILRLNAATWTWSEVGKLNSIRRGHQVVVVDNTFMVLGGGDIRHNEACTLNNDEFTCEEKTSKLNYYGHTPLVVLVDDDYRNC